MRTLSLVFALSLCGSLLGCVDDVQDADDQSDSADDGDDQAPEPGPPLPTCASGVQRLKGDGPCLPQSDTTEL